MGEKNLTGSEGFKFFRWVLNKVTTFQYANTLVDIVQQNLKRKPVLTLDAAKIFKILCVEGRQ